MKILLLSFLILLVSCGQDGVPSVPASTLQDRVGVWGYYDGVEGMFIQFHASGVYNVFYISGRYINESAGTFTDNGSMIATSRMADDCDTAAYTQNNYRETGTTMSFEVDNLTLILEKLDEVPDLSSLIHACF